MTKWLFSARPIVEEHLCPRRTLDGVQREIVDLAGQRNGVNADRVDVADGDVVGLRPRGVTLVVEVSVAHPHGVLAVVEVWANRPRCRARRQRGCRAA